MEGLYLMKKLIMLLFLVLLLSSCGNAEDTYDGVYQIYDSKDNIVNENWYIQILDNTWISYEVGEGKEYVQIPNIDKCLKNKNSKFYKNIYLSVTDYNWLDESERYIAKKQQINIFYQPYNYNNKYYNNLYSNLEEEYLGGIFLIQLSFYEAFDMKELYYFGYHEVETIAEGLKIGSAIVQYESGLITFEDATGAIRQLKRVKKL